MKAGDCESALPLLEQSHALDPALGTRFNMAVCEARVGKLTQAAEHFRSVVASSAAGDERRTHAERALNELLPRIPKLIVEVDEARHALESVRLDGQSLSDLRANEPFAINPGAHELEVVLRDEAPRTRRFSVAERQLYTWSVGATFVTPAPISAQSTSPTGASNDSPRTDAAHGQPGFVWTTRRTAAAVAGGVSIAAFGVGTGFALSARSIYDSSNCTADDVCGPGGMEARARARTHGKVATIAVTVGVASALAAGVLWFTGEPRSSAPSTPLRVDLEWNDPRAPTRGGAIVVEGSYW